MALRKRGGKPEPEEEEDLDEGQEEGDAEEEGEEEAGDEEAGEEEAGEEEAKDEDEAGEEESEEEDEDEEDEEEEVSTKSRRGPAAKGTIKDKPVMDGYTWITVLTFCLCIIAIIVQVRDHSAHWRMGVVMDKDPVRTTTHFNTASEEIAESKTPPKFGDVIDSKKDRFGQDVMEYQEVTATDANDYPQLKKRVFDNTARGDRPVPNLGDVPDSVEPLAPLYGLAAVEWTNKNAEAAAPEGATPSTTTTTPPPATTTPPADAGAGAPAATPPPAAGTPVPPADGAAH